MIQGEVTILGERWFAWNLPCFRTNRQGFQILGDSHSFHQH